MTNSFIQKNRAKNISYNTTKKKEKIYISPSIPQFYRIAQTKLTKSHPRRKEGGRLPLRWEPESNSRTRILVSFARDKR